MSEYNMTTRGGGKAKGSATSSSEFETSFMEAIEPALNDIAERKIRVAVNAGASDTKKLHDALNGVVRAKGLDLKVAWIEGDEVSGLFDQSVKSGNEFKNLTTGTGSLLLRIDPQLTCKLPQAKPYRTGSSPPSMRKPIWEHGGLQKHSTKALTLCSVDESLMPLQQLAVLHFTTTGNETTTTNWLTHSLRVTLSNAQPM
jgi:hypothetical protein